MKKQTKNTKKTAPKSRVTQNTASNAPKTHVKVKTTNKSTKPQNNGKKCAPRGRNSTKPQVSVRETKNGLAIYIKQDAYEDL